MQYPYLKLVTQPTTTFVPLMVGSLKNFDQISDLLLPYFEDSESLFVFSNDFCHWGKRFSYTPMNVDKEPIYETIRNLNFKGFELIKGQDLKLAHQRMDWVLGRHKEHNMRMQSDQLLAECRLNSCCKRRKRTSTMWRW